MKKIIQLAALAGALMVSGAAFAQGNSTPGIDRYNANPGRQQATEVGAQCGSGAGSGAFGFFGKGNNLKGGADGQATGDANSGICGNKDGTKHVD
ncbi:MAG TPA: hypothetical protein VF601_02225 [Beijerinckiaceae bacterium]|jgi:uncharacterized low-complexity protein